MSEPRRPLIEIHHLKKYFPVSQTLLELVSRRRQKWVKAVDDISFDIYEGETLGLVGESGCGKSTLSKTISRLVEPDSGRLVFDGQDFTAARGSVLRQMRFRMQMIFQDPFSSLNPAMTVRQMFNEIFSVNHICGRGEWQNEAVRLLGYVHMDAGALDRKPGNFSGGQRQRLTIARALAMNPYFLIADEPVSALDVSIQAQVINLLIDLQKRLHLTILFISHDMRVVRYLTDRVAVMYLGRIVELGPTEDIYLHPAHPYTDILLKAAPVIGKRSAGQYVIEGEPPSPVDLPAGCRFSSRCPFADDQCLSTEPELLDTGDGRTVACHHPLNGKHFAGKDR